MEVKLNRFVMMIIVTFRGKCGSWLSSTSSVRRNGPKFQQTNVRSFRKKPKTDPNHLNANLMNSVFLRLHSGNDINNNIWSLYNNQRSITNTEAASEFVPGYAHFLTTNRMWTSVPDLLQMWSELILERIDESWSHTKLVWVGSVGNPKLGRFLTYKILYNIIV